MFWNKKIDKNKKYHFYITPKGYGRKIKELEEINKDHQRMNIELREENKRLKRYLDDKMKDLQNIYTQYIRLQNTYDDLYDKYIDIVEGRNENE